MSQAAYAHDQELQRRDSEDAFERAYTDWANAPDGSYFNATEKDWQLIAHDMGVTEHYRRIK